MKKIFRLSAMVAMISMMATATVATSCSDDDDDDDTTTVTPVADEWKDAAKSINAVAGTSFKAKNNGDVYSIDVVSAETGKVVVKVLGKEVTLSDAGTSYLNKAGEGVTKATAEAAPADIILCLLNGSTTLASATEGANATIKAGAKETLVK